MGKLFRIKLIVPTIFFVVIIILINLYNAVFAESTCPAGYTNFEGEGVCTQYDTLPKPELILSRNYTKLLPGQVGSTNWSTRYTQRRGYSSPESTLTLRCTGEGTPDVTTNKDFNLPLSRTGDSSTYEQLVAGGWEGKYNCTWTLRGPGGTTTVNDIFEIVKSTSPEGICPTGYTSFEGDEACTQYDTLPKPELILSRNYTKLLPGQVGSTNWSTRYTQRVGYPAPESTLALRCTGEGTPDVTTNKDFNLPLSRTGDSSSYEVLVAGGWEGKYNCTWTLKGPGGTTTVNDVFEIKKTDTAAIHHILSTGQSLSTGYGGTPVLTIKQPYSNIMLNGSKITPLIEVDVETMSSAMANFITSNSIGQSYRIAVTRHGANGLAYTQLKKGTSFYANGLEQVKAMKNSITGNAPYQVVAVTTIHGESDHGIGTTQSQYEGYLAEWQRDYESDIQAITGQASAIPLITDQMSSLTFYGQAYSVIPQAQLDASERNPGKIYLVGPKYFLNYSDGSHLTNESYRWLGEYYGKVLSKVTKGEGWTPLSPSQIIRNGNIILVQFNVPVGPLKFDTTTVSQRKNYGFEYFDDTSSASIIGVELATENTVKIILDRIPSGDNQKLAYGHTGIPGSWAGAQIAGSVGGNLRDSDNSPSQYGNTLYNWSVQFIKPIKYTPTVSPSAITSSPFSTNNETTTKKSLSILEPKKSSAINIPSSLDANSRARIDMVMSKIETKISTMGSQKAIQFIDTSIVRISSLPEKNPKAILIKAYTVEKLSSLKSKIVLSGSK